MLASMLANWPGETYGPLCACFTVKTGVVAVSEARILSVVRWEMLVVVICHLSLCGRESVLL